MLTKKQKIIKRSFDIFFSIIGTFFLSIPIITLIIISTIIHKQNGLFTQTRIGQFAKPFVIFKIRSMHTNKNITKFGKFIRKYHIDEFPQILNVLIGNMSFVGPRPDIKGFADQLKGENLIILSIKPGITGPASIRFKNEDSILAKQKEPEKYNKEIIWKKKIKLNKQYIKNWSLSKDISYLYKTIL